MTTLVCSAHPDDEVIGVGGTIAKLAKKEKVIVLIFSYGGGSIFGLSDRITSWPPLMTEERLTRRRVKESLRADEILGVKETIFLGLKGNLPKEFRLEQKEKILDLINKHKPNKIFFHSVKDGHPDHLAVNKVMRDVINRLKKKPQVFTYQINLFDFSKKEPKVIYDVSEEYRTKIRALNAFKSQRLWMYLLEPLIILKGIYSGRSRGSKFAEYFYAE
jgi:LmbE family N-acetylglucosaminyl deacetylase